MRVDGNNNSEDCWRNKFAQCPLILLDGKEMSHVAMADDEKGVVEVEIWENGKLKVVDYENEVICTKLLTGKVEIVGRLLGQSAN